jgi:hypothetical protein
MNIYSRSFVLNMKDIGVSCPDQLADITIEHIHFKTTVNSLPPDIKRIVGICNKLSATNYSTLLEETKTFNYADPQVITIIFSKILLEPTFSELYARFCTDLVDLHGIVNDKCLEEFRKTYHKNAGIFIAEIYKIGVLKNMQAILDDLLTNTTEKKLESLCKIISVVGVKNKVFKNVIPKLREMKSTVSPRYKFMIMDLLGE